MTRVIITIIIIIIFFQHQNDFSYFVLDVRMYVATFQKPTIRYRSPVALNIAGYTNIYQTYVRMKKKKRKIIFAGRRNFRLQV